MCGNAVGEALATVTGGGGACDALEHQNLAFVADGLGECISSLLATGNVVGGDEGVNGSAACGAVHSNDRDVGVVEGLNGGYHGVGIRGVDNDDLGASSRSVVELVVLLGCVVGCVLDVELDAQFIGFLLCAFLQLHEEGVRPGGQRQCDGVVTAAGAGVARIAVAGSGTECKHQCRRHGRDFLESFLCEHDVDNLS